MLANVRLQRGSPVLDIDHVNIGPYIRNTLAADKNSSREEALFDIYRVMRPGEPPDHRYGGGYVPVALFRCGTVRSFGGRARGR